MAERAMHRLVIDVSVAQAAGSEEAVNGVSRACREFLATSYDLEFRVAMTPDIVQEWKRHRSGWARKWQYRMFGRKLLEQIEPEPGSELLDRVDTMTVSAEQQQAMRKDVHLLDAALATDRRVVSRDDKVRSLFRSLAEEARKVADVVWVNPVTPEEQAVAWLENGAPEEKHRQLGHRG